MSTNLKDALAVMKTAVSTSAVISAFCTANFKKQPTIFVGINPLNPPQLEQYCPVIAIWVGGRSRVANQAYRIHAVNIGTGIMDNTQTVTGNVHEFRGVTTLDNFANLVEEVVVKALNASGYATTQEPAFEDENTCPYFKAVNTLMVRCPSRL